ncbi:glycosyltransferase family 39 protein [Candidatus Shapirobacteria bacterium]|nr:glycosyltransferase family 39 protein [Candidatus Shapirobacteria bacterium]
MPTKLISRFALPLIIVLALILRSWSINSFPSLNPDEAALGYNAYSLLQTNKDEHGANWPLHFKSFGDYKPGGYVYLALPFIKLLGLNVLAARLPNLIFSVLTIYFLYKLVLLLTRNSQLSTLSAFVLAVNPWHIHFSRGAWETSTALFFIVLGLYLFYSYILNLKSSFLYLSILAFVASLYIYHSARLITPLLVLFLLISNWSLVISNYKKFILPVLFGIIITLPVLVSFLRNGGTSRFGGVGLTADYGPISRSEELLNQDMNTALFYRAIHNKRLLYALSWGEKYFSHFNLNFLFINGDEVPRSKSPEMGQLYLIELPFLIIGIIFLIRTPARRGGSYFLNLKSLVLALLLIAPIASSLTFQAPSALRALPMVIPLSILVACGLYSFISFIHTSYFLNLISFFMVVGYLYSLAYFLSTYYIHAPRRYPYAWNTGFDQVVPYINQQRNNFENIYLTDKYDQPYILYLFYSLYPPAQIQSQIKLSPPDRFGFSTVRQIDNIHFDKIDWNNIPSNSLIISANESIPIEPGKQIIIKEQRLFNIYEK